MIINGLNGVGRILKLCVYHNTKRITKSDKSFAMRLDFKDIKFPDKLHKHSHSQNRKEEFHQD